MSIYHISYTHLHGLQRVSDCDVCHGAGAQAIYVYVYIGERQEVQMYID